MKSIIMKYELAEAAHHLSHMLFFLPAEPSLPGGFTTIARDELTGERFIYERLSTDIKTIYGVRILWPRFHKGETVFVKESWGFNAESLSSAEKIEYGFSHDNTPLSGWKAPVTLSLCEARTFFEVCDITPMLLHEITEEQAELTGIIKEGGKYINYMYSSRFVNSRMMQRRAELWPRKTTFCSTAKESFASMWEVHTQHDMVASFGWEKNPCVWMVDLKRTNI